MSSDRLPSWARDLTTEDLNFIRNFLLESGSLKAMAVEYGVSYPTIRARLDQLIERIRMADKERIDPFHSRLKDMVASGDVEPHAARELLDLHRKQIGGDKGERHE